MLPTPPTESSTSSHYDTQECEVRDREVGCSLKVSRSRPGNQSREGAAPLYINGSPLRLGVRGYAIIRCVYPSLPIRSVPHSGGPFREEAETCGYTRMTLGSMPLRPIVIEYQLLLLRRFHSTRDIASHPLESLSTRKTQVSLCQVGCKQSSTPNAR